MRTRKTGKTYGEEYNHFKGGFPMAMIDLTTDELEVIRKSLNNCKSTCHDGGPSTGCPDCQKIDAVLAKI